MNGSPHRHSIAARAIGEADMGVHPHSRCRARYALARHGGLQRGSATPHRLLTDHTFAVATSASPADPRSTGYSLDITSGMGRCSAPVDGPLQPPARAFKVGCIGAVEGKNKRGRIVVHFYLHEV